MGVGRGKRRRKNGRKVDGDLRLGRRVVFFIFLSCGNIWISSFFLSFFLSEAVGFIDEQVHEIGMIFGKRIISYGPIQSSSQHL